MNKALFLDRDGVINIDYGHVHLIKDFRFCEGIFDLCKKYQNEGYLIIVITNQAGIAKKYYSEEQFLILNKWMIKKFKENGIDIAKVYYCPHKPEDHCDCRKPKAGLYIKAIKDFDIDPSLSIQIGDKMSDLEAAHSVGVKTLFFKKTNYPEEKHDFEYNRL